MTIELPASFASELLESPRVAGLFQQESIYHFWAVGQSVVKMGDSDGEIALFNSAAPLPEGPPFVALLDGLPIANHPQLAGRLEIDDPDDVASNYPVNLRGHGTQMASALIHGDLSAPTSPLPSPLYVRPILQPKPDGQGEWIPSEQRPNDLLARCIHRMKVGDGDEEPEAPFVQVVNLSIGDVQRVFDGLHHSSWARMIDWLQYRYNVLIIVSAGNAPSFRFGKTQSEFEELGESEREKALFEARFSELRQLRLISPAETLNGLTIGASHADAAGPYTLGVGFKEAVFHPDLPAPYSRSGPGFRQAVKPELLMPGGRSPLRIQNDDATVYQQGRAPGIKVASCPSSSGDTNREAFTRGTSPAAALATREAAFFIQSIQEMGTSIPPSEFQPVLIKALLVHSASWHAGEARLREHFGTLKKEKPHQWKPKTVMPQIGYGRFRDYQDVNSATILGWGEISADEVLQFALPVPSCLKGRKGKRRLTVTLAWFSPINPKNRRYRVAKLGIKFPESPNDIVAKKGTSDVGVSESGKGTVQHEIYEGRAPRGIVDDEFKVEVECLAEGGVINERIRFGLVVSLEGEASIFPELRQQIQERLEVQSRIQV